MKIFCTIDFFFDRWDDAGKRNLWMGIFPYVKNAKDLARWVDTVASDGSLAQYQLLTYDEFAHDDSDLEDRRALVPLPLSDDTDFRVVIPGLGSVGPDRLRSFIVSDPERFRELNEETRLTPITEINETGSGLVNPVMNQPYAVSLVSGIKAAIGQENDPSNPEGLADWLKFSFEIGQSKRFNDDCMTSQGAYISVEHRDDPMSATTQSANHHCMSGLMVPLGGDIAALKTITDIQIEFLVDGNPHQSLDLTADMNGALALRRMFSTIDSSLGEMAPRLSWVDSLKQRVYALPTPNLFRRESLRNGPTLYRLPRLAPGEERNRCNLNLVNINRLVTRYGQQIDELTGAPTEPHPVGVNSLKLLATRTFDVRIRPYHSYPLDPTLPFDGYLLQLVAQPHEIERWIQLLTTTYDDNNSGELTGLQIFLEAEDSFKQIDFEWSQLFRLPWESEDSPVLLLYSKEPVSGQALVMVAPTRHNRFNLVMKGIDENSDPFGKRWEYIIPTGVEDIVFDGLVLEGDYNDLDVDKLIVTSFSNTEYQFELAQSARRIEGVAKVEMDIAPHKLPSQVTAKDEYLSDLVNYNSANYVSDWADQRTLLTTATESVADYAKVLNDVVHYSFQFRFTHPTSARSTMDDVQKYYRELYAKLGTVRNIYFDLEHTYGTSIYLDPPHIMRTSLDEPLSNPAQVGTADKDQHKDLLRVEYIEESDNDKLRLTFCLRILSRAWIDKQPATDHAKLLEANVEAWQAIAEAAYADIIEIITQPYAFNFMTALNRHGKSIGDGLINTVPPIVMDLTNTLKTVFNNWLNTDLGENPSDWTLELDVPDAPLWQSSNVLRCFMRVKRGEKLSVPKDKVWSVVSNLVAPPIGGMENIVGADGYGVDSITTDVSEMLASWIDSVRGSSTYLTPTLGSNDNRDRYRGLIGAGQQDTNAIPNADHWIVPKGDKLPESKSSVAVVPIGFRPISRTTLLGDATGQMLRRYFAQLDYVLSMSSEKIAKELKADDWRTLLSYFDLLLSKGGKGWALYRLMCDNATDLLHPVPDTLEPDSDSYDIVPEVVEVSKALKSNTGIGIAVKQRFRQRLAASPALYANNKAMCFYRVYGNTMDRPAADGLYALQVDKRIQSSNETGLAESRDTYTAIFNQGLAPEGNYSWYGLLEDLDDEVYDNEFQITELGLRSAEDLLEDRDKQTFSVPLVDNSIFVPAKEAQILDKTADIPFIYLPSRRMVRKPILIGTGIYDLTQNPASFELGFPMGKSRDFNAFINGRAAEPLTGIVPIKRVAKSPDMLRSGSIDDKVVSYLFAVVGDEEFELDWINGLANDAFMLGIVENEHIYNAENHLSPGNVVEGVFELLESPDTARDSVELIGVLHEKVLEYVSNTLAQPAPVVVEPKDYFVRFTIERGISGEPSVVVNYGSNNPLGKQALQIHLFRQADIGNDDLLYIWINVELPVWLKNTATLQQSRNFSDAERRFEKVFAMLSEIQSSGAQLRQSLIANAAAWGPISMERKLYSPKEFLKALLIDKPDASIGPIVRELGEIEEILIFDVNITISELIAPIFPVQTPGSSDSDKKYELRIGKFPLASIRVRAENGELPVPGTVPWRVEIQDVKYFFPSASKRFIVDVEWRHTDTNDILFRVEEVEIVLD